MEQIYKKFPNDTRRRPSTRCRCRSNGAAHRQDVREPAEGRRRFSSRSSASSPSIRAWTHYLIHSYDVPPLAPRGAGRRAPLRGRSRPTRRTRSTCQHTRSRASAHGRNRSTPTSARTTPPCKQSARARPCTRWTTWCTRTCRPTQDAAAKKVLDELDTMIAGPPTAGAGPAAGRRQADFPPRPSRRATRSSATRGRRPPPAVAERHALRRGDDALRARPWRARSRQRRRPPGGHRSARALRERRSRPTTRTGPTQVEIERQSADAWVLWAEGKQEAALKPMARRGGRSRTRRRSPP